MALISWSALAGHPSYTVGKEKLGRAAGQVRLCVRQKGTRNRDWVQAQPDGLRWPDQTGPSGAGARERAAAAEARLRDSGKP